MKRWLMLISGIAWVWSWYTMYLEVFRWHHVTTSLRFNPGPLIQGTDRRPAAGWPLKALCACAAVAPLVFTSTATATFAHRHRSHSADG